MFVRKDNRRPACDECKRRKVRCSSEPRCFNCTRDRKSCVYSSASHNLTALQREVEEQRAVIERMKRAWDKSSPGKSINQVLDSLNSNRDLPNSENQTHAEDIPASVTTWESEPVDSPESLDVSGVEQSNAAEFEFDESRNEFGRSRSRAPLEERSQDSGYTGPQSGAAALKFLKSLPSKVGLFETDVPLEHPSQFTNTEQDSNDPRVKSSAINQYFEFFHPAYPLLHEGVFRARVSGVLAKPKDGSWPLVYNMVTAMGAFCGDQGTSTLDLDYYRLARDSISLSVLEKGSLDYVQGLALMSQYLQKRNKPNAGFAMIGVAWSMALAIGLHREFGTSSTSLFTMEIRRRTWWTLYCFVSEAQLIFGRPPASLIGINVQLPANIDDTSLSVDMERLPVAEKVFTSATSLIAEARLAMLTNSVQALLLSTPNPSAAAIASLDQKLADWESNLSAFLSSNEVSSQWLEFPKQVLLWRSYNLRIVLNRPRLFSAIASKASIKEYDRCIQQCVVAADLSVGSITASLGVQAAFRRGFAWYATQYLITASFVHAICLAYCPTHSDSEKWREKIDQSVIVLRQLGHMHEGAHRAEQILSKLLQSTGPSSRQITEGQGPSLSPDGAWCTFMNAAVHFNAREGVDSTSLRLENQSSLGLGSAQDPLWPWYADTSTGSIGVDGDFSIFESSQQWSW